MKKVFLIIPIELGAGSTTTALGIKHVFDQRGLQAGLFWPVGVPKQAVANIAGVKPVFDVPSFKAKLAANKMPEIMEHLIAAFDQQNKHNDIVCVLGIAETSEVPQAKQFNMSLAKSLDARIILVASGMHQNTRALEQRINMVRESFAAVSNRIEGVVFNKVGIPLDRNGRPRPDLSVSLSRVEQPAIHPADLASCQSLLPVLGCIDWDKSINRPRTIDLTQVCDVDYINEGEAAQRRISWLMVATRSVDSLAKNLKANTLIVTAGDRDDVLMMAALAELQGIKLAGLLLTASTRPSPESLQLIQTAMQSGLPVMVVNAHTYDVVSSFPNMFVEIPEDDDERFSALMNHIATSLDAERLIQMVNATHQCHLSPAAFRYALVKRAQEVQRSIVLPEGDEPRTLQAANICAQRGMAHCVLLGDRRKILVQCEALDIDITDALNGSSIKIIEPREVYQRYISPLVKLRSHKGMNEVLAKESLLDNTILLGTMMLQCGDVDGLVSGAVNTTAATVQPALQIIKTKPGHNLVSSCFFMCLPDQVLVYADCAINPDPNAQQLADIAVQSAESAHTFGIEPKVAMLSYSTGSSGQGADVDKVREATALAQAKIANYPVDGPLQYDAASVANVAQSKAPESSVAGQATVFIFPDLNTGNTTYKAVQRSAGVISIGPMLQGLNKPVNDLSRGALVDDIVYTIALTAIQAAGNKA